MKSLVLSSEIPVIADYAIYGNNTMSVYTDAKETPETWSARWNISRLPVVWGCTLSADKTYVSGLTISDETFTNAYKIITETYVEIDKDGKEVVKKKTVGKEFKVADPTREGYVFLGWSSSASATVGEYSTEDLTALAKGTVVYAVWELAPVVEETPQEPDVSPETENA